MKRGLSGVYKISNVINGKFYIGSSVDIDMRYGTHMGRDARKFKDTHDFYREIIEYGKDNFKLEVLKFCDKEDLLEWEQYYYDELNPQYNKVRPAENNFMHDEVRIKANKASNTPEMVAKRKELYNSQKYTNLFRTMHADKMRAVVMIKDGVELDEFISIREASRFIDNNTDFKGKNKTSKIKAVCDGERKSAYGYNWRYKNV